MWYLVHVYSLIVIFHLLLVSVHGGDFALGDDVPVCWRTNMNISGSAPEKLNECPLGVTIEFIEPLLPYNMINMGNYLAYYRIAVPVYPTSAFTLKLTLVNEQPCHLVHVNIHSCFSSVSDCTPFIANTPTLR